MLPGEGLTTRITGALEFEAWLTARDIAARARLYAQVQRVRWYLRYLAETGVVEERKQPCGRRVTEYRRVVVVVTRQP